MSKKSVAVWDLPTRLFHWALAASVLGAFATVNAGEMEWHKFCGYVALTLVVFRVIWGFIGSETAQFRDFVRSPAAVSAYLRGGRSPTLGHNPLGALSVVALLALVATQAVTGMFSNDDIFFDGPWAGSVGKETSDAFTGWHHTNKNLLLGLILLHVVAIGWYVAAKNEELLSPMLHGRKQVAEDKAAPSMANPLVALGAFVGAAVVTAALFRYWLL